MKARTTIALLILAAGAIAYVFFVDRHGKTTAEAAEVAHLLATIDPGEVNEIKIEDGAGVARIKLADGEWLVTRPYKDRADQEFARSLIELCTTLEITEQVSDNSAVQGIDPFDASAKEITLKKSKDENLVRVQLGKSAPFENSIYARDTLTEDATVYVVRSPELALRLRPVAEYRDPELLPIGASEITRLQIQRPDGVIEIARADASESAQWWITKPLKTRADNIVVAELIAALTATTVSVPADSATGNGSPATFDDLASTVTAWGANPDAPSVIQMVESRNGEESRTVIAKIEGRPSVFEIEPAVMDALSVMPNDLRSDTLAALDPKALHSIVIKGPGGSIPMFLQGSRWWLARSGRPEEANTARVAALVKALNNHQILEFTSDAASDLTPYGLDRPLFEITFSSAKIESADGVGRIPLTAGNSVTLRVGRGESGRIYANFTNEPFVYAVDPSIISDVPTEPVKWKGLRITEFSTFDLRGIDLTEGMLPPLRLRRDESLVWSASRPGLGGDPVDLSADIDQKKVTLLGDTLAIYYADDWLQDRGAAITRLNESPAFQIDILLERLDFETNERTSETVTLKFVKASESALNRFYFGLREGLAEVFLITAEKYRELTASLLKEEDPKGAPQPPPK